MSSHIPLDSLHPHVYLFNSHSPVYQGKTEQVSHSTSPNLEYDVIRRVLGKLLRLYFKFKLTDELHSLYSSPNIVNIINQGG
jgi:hypothetical protein